MAGNGERANQLTAPFPWIGGKRKVAHEVWARFGGIVNYVEPFFGSGAVLLGNPCPVKYETVNDVDGFISNFWRSVRSAPEDVARWANWPLTENDHHARHYWLVERKNDLTKRLEGDPDFYDAKIAGWWVWGVSICLGAYCLGKGPWYSEGGRLVRTEGRASDLPRGVRRSLPNLSRWHGVHCPPSRVPNEGTDLAHEAHLEDRLRVLSDRLRYVRVACGDWSRMTGSCVTHNMGITGLFFDPPYGESADRYSELYSCDNLGVAEQVREYCVKNGNNSKLRIALCGYEGEHDVLASLGWSCYRWIAGGGYAIRSKVNRFREVIWFSPYCLNPSEILLHEDEMPNGLHWEIQAAP